MDHLDRLKNVTILAQKEDELPDFLANRIFAIIASLRHSGDLLEEINDLSSQVEQYDTFGQTGYCGMGVDNNILECAIARIELLIKEN